MKQITVLARFSPVLARRFVTGLAAWLGIVFAGAAVDAQESELGTTIVRARPEADRETGRPLVLEGFVLSPDGNPAEGVVVVSSAGGKAVTDVAGSYQLAIEVPSEATSVEVTALGGAGGNLAARTSVSARGAQSPTRVDPLLLARGSSCTPSWLPTFGRTFGLVREPGALVVYDDGSGPALYAGCPRGVERWDGSSSWSLVGGGVNGTHITSVNALVVYDDGSGPALYVGGDFETAGGVSASCIAKWDGESWSALGNGLNDWVGALVVYDDGGGPALYAGGGFTIAGLVAANRVARWNGSSWSRVGFGMNNDVRALVVHDDGSGQALYAGGEFTTAGVAAANRIARWNGTSWSALGSGMDLDVRALVMHDDGSGPALYAGGAFTSAGGVAANRVARWDGSSWSAIGAAFNYGPGVAALTTHDDGGGRALYAAVSEWSGTGSGYLLKRVAKWDGASWSILASVDEEVLSFAEFDAGDGSMLYVGGEFNQVNGIGGARRIARWDGATWLPLGGGLDASVSALLVHDQGAGAKLYAAGSFDHEDGAPLDHVGRWDGSAWSALGSGTNGIRALAMYDDGGGPALYAGGSFTIAGGVPASGVAKWNGTSWSALGSGAGGVFALAVYDDGGGPELYAAGGFTSAGGVAANRIARWNGTAWSSLGSGLQGAEPYTVANALAVYDEGGGPALYAGGVFTSAGGVAATSIAKWNGAAWSEVGSGPNGASNVFALAVYDDGGGEALYAGGALTSGIAKWEGSSWSAIGGAGLANVRALGVHDDGSGAGLYAGGYFTSAGAVAANRIARWNGTSWSALGSGLGPDFTAVLALASFDTGGATSLYVGGSFGADGDWFLARWGCFNTDPPVLTCPAFVSVIDRVADGPGEVVTFTVTASDGLDPAPDVVCAPPSGSVFPRGTTMVTCTATDAEGNQDTCQFPVTVTLKVRQRGF